MINISSVALIWFGGLRIDAGQMQVGLADRVPVLLHADPDGGAAGDVHPGAACRARRCAPNGSPKCCPPTPRSPARSIRCGPPTIDGEIRLDDATFSYPGADRPVLQDVSLTARPGTTTAIVGSTGSGKSTLVSLICRLYDVTGGSVRVDGVDVRDYDTEQLWSAIGLVPQRGYLFSGTVADNLRYGKADATDEEMWEALRVAAADDFVARPRRRAGHARSPRAASTSRADSGNGWRSRARSSAGPPIYLFDDAFSALDVHTDARVRAALREVSAGFDGGDCVAAHFDGRARPTRSSSSTTAAWWASARTRRCWPTAPTYAEFADSQSLGAGAGGTVTGPMARPIRGVVQAPTERSRDFKGSAIRLVKRLTPQRGLTATVILLGVGGIAIGVIGPRILGHATDLLFNGVIGRQLPAGLTKEQAIEAARARGDNTFADLLSGMNVVPGQGVDFGAIGRTLLLALGPVSGCRAAGLAAGAAAQRRGAAHHGGAALRRRGQGAPDAVVATSTPGSAARCSAGSPTTSTTFRRRCR